MKGPTLRATLLAVLLATAAPLAAETVTYVHAGRVLDVPGRAPRGPSTIVIRDGRIEAVRDGHVAPAG